MTTIKIMQDGEIISVDSSDFRVPTHISAPLLPQTVFDPATLIETLFTPAEQLGFMDTDQGRLFATLITARQSIDITSAEFRAKIAAAVAGGMLTQARADQVLAGTPAPQDLPHA